MGMRARSGWKGSDSGVASCDNRPLLEASWASLDRAKSYVVTDPPFKGNDGSRALHVVDFTNEDHVAAWRNLCSSELHAGSDSERLRATDAFEHSVRVPTRVYSDVWQTANELPTASVRHVAKVLTFWRKTEPSAEEVFNALRVVWMRVNDRQRPAIESFADAILWAVRRGAALRHLAGLAGVSVYGRLLALLLETPRVDSRGPSPIGRLRFSVSRRGPPSHSSWNRWGGLAEVTMTA
jgi:hypothetical protein